MLSCVAGPRKARLPARSRLAFDTQYAVKTDVQTSNEAAVNQLPSSTLPSPTATAKSRPVTPILGFVINGYFVVLAAVLNKPEPRACGPIRSSAWLRASLKPPGPDSRQTPGAMECFRPVCVGSIKRTPVLCNSPSHFEEVQILLPIR